MKFWEPVYENSISDEINRICGTTNVVYTNKQKVARVNDAMDRYFSFAHRLDSKWLFDDSNQSSPSIQTINLVNGQRRYELDDFTSEILNISRVEVLDNDGNDILLRPISIDEIGYPYDDYAETAGNPYEYTKLGKFLDLHPAPNYNRTNGLKIYFDRPPARYLFVTFTVTIASPGVFTATAHGLAANDELIFETDGALPTGLTADTTRYFVISTGLTADDFRVSTTKSGSAVNTSGSQSGNHTFLKVNKEPGIPSIHHIYLARYASLSFLIEKKLPQKNDIAVLIQKDEQEIFNFFSKRNKDERNIMSISQRRYK